MAQLPEDARVHKLVSEVAIIPILSDSRVLGVLQVQTGAERQLNPADIGLPRVGQRSNRRPYGTVELIQQIARSQVARRHDRTR